MLFDIGHLLDLSSLQDQDYIGNQQLACSHSDVVVFKSKIAHVWDSTSLGWYVLGSPGTVHVITLAFCNIGCNDLNCVSVTFAGSLTVMVTIQIITSVSLVNLVSRKDEPPFYIISRFDGTFGRILCLSDSTPLLGQVTLARTLSSCCQI